MSVSGAVRLDLRRGPDRARTRSGGIDTAHSFAFGAVYDPANVFFGLLLAHNEDVLAPGAGYPDHLHRDVEIVTWVLSGVLTHRGEHGPARKVPAGAAQALSAGSGTVHAEVNAGAEPVHLVQMWLAPAGVGGAPRYACADLNPALAVPGLVRLAAGRYGEHPAALPIRQPDAAVHVGRLPAGASAPLPPALYVHVFAAAGDVLLDAGPAGRARLGPGDAARLSGPAAARLTAVAPAEVLVWEMHAAIGADRPAG